MKIWNVKIFCLFPVSLFALQRRRSHKSGRLGIQLRGSCASYQGQSSVPPSSLFISQTSSRHIERYWQFSFGGDGTDRYIYICVYIIYNNTTIHSGSKLYSDTQKTEEIYFELTKRFFSYFFLYNIILIIKKFLLRQN